MNMSRRGGGHLGLPSNHQTCRHLGVCIRLEGDIVGAVLQRTEASFYLLGLEMGDWRGNHVNVPQGPRYNLFDLVFIPILVLVHLDNSQLGLMLVLTSQIPYCTLSTVFH